MAAAHAISFGFTLDTVKTSRIASVVAAHIFSIRNALYFFKYGEPLTQRLADNFLPYLKKYNAFLVENHGLVIMSPWDIAWTMMLTELLETTSATLIPALAIGGVKEISREDVINLENTMKTRGLPMFGAPGENDSLVSLYYDE